MGRLLGPKSVFTWIMGGSLRSVRNNVSCRMDAECIILLSLLSGMVYVESGSVFSSSTGSGSCSTLLSSDDPIDSVSSRCNEVVAIDSSRVPVPMQGRS